MDVKTTKTEIRKLIGEISESHTAKVTLLQELLCAQEKENNSVLNDVIQSREEGERNAERKFDKLEAKYITMKHNYEELEEKYEQLLERYHALDAENLDLKGRLIRKQNKLRTTSAQTAKDADGDGRSPSGSTCMKKAMIVEEKHQDIKIASSIGIRSSYPSNAASSHLHPADLSDEVTSKAVYGLSLALNKLIEESLDLDLAVFAAFANTDEKTNIPHDNIDASKDDNDSGVHDGKEEEEEEAMDMDECGQNGSIGQTIGTNSNNVILMNVNVAEDLIDHRAETIKFLDSKMTALAISFMNYFHQYCFDTVKNGYLSVETAVNGFLLYTPINYLDMAAEAYMELVKKQLADAARVVIAMTKRDNGRNL